MRSADGPPDGDRTREQRAPVVAGRPAGPALGCGSGDAPRDASRSAPEAPGTGVPPPSVPLSGAPPEQAGLRAEIAGLTADLQRVKAEYDNYRKRVRRDRLAVREVAVLNVLTGLLPVLDAVERARAHEGRGGGGLAAVADLLDAQLGALGLEAVGAAGDPFDPHAHEAVSYRTSAEADRAVCEEVLRQGYRIGDRLLRPAQVAVAGPPGGDRSPDPGHPLADASR